MVVAGALEVADGDEDELHPAIKTTARMTARIIPQYLSFISNSLFSRDRGSLIFENPSLN